MNSITFIQTVELIDIAANEDRLWHYNGAQAYIRVNNDSNVLMIIDHARGGIPTVSLHDGTSYFNEYAGAQFTHSAKLRESSLVAWFQERFSDVLPLETV